jgi:hypothetical protein
MVSTSIAKRISKRPPRKPPWKTCVLVTLSLSVLRSNNCIGVFMIFMFCLFVCVLLLVFSCFKFLLRVFAEKLESNSFCWYRVLSKRLIVVITKFNMLASLQMNCQHMVELIIPKTTNSRNVRTPATIFLRGWIQLKTVGLSLILIVGQLFKNLVWLPGLGVWFMTVILPSEISMCISDIYLAFKMWM